MICAHIIETDSFGQWDKEDKAKVCIVRRDGDSIKLRAETPEEVNDLLYQISLARVSLRIWRLEVNHLTAIICFRGHKF